MIVLLITDPFNCSSEDFSCCSKLVCSLDCSSYDAGRTNNRKFKSVAFPLLVIVLVSIKCFTPNEERMAKSLIEVNFFGQTLSSSIVYSYFPARPLCRRRNALIQWFSVSLPLGHTSSFQTDPRLSTISLEKTRCGPFFGTNLRKVKWPTVYFGLVTSSGFRSLKIVMFKWYKLDNSKSKCHLLFWLGQCTIGNPFKRRSKVFDFFEALQLNQLCWLEILSAVGTASRVTHFLFLRPGEPLPNASVAEQCRTKRANVGIFRQLQTNHTLQLLAEPSERRFAVTLGLERHFSECK